MGSDCFDLIMKKNLGNEKNVAMQYNNDYEKSLPLHYAVLGRNVKNVRTLLGLMRGKPSAKKQKKPKDAQSIAFQKFREQRYGQHVLTGVDAQESNGFTALHLAAFQAASPETHSKEIESIIKLLMKHGANPNLTNDLGDTSVMLIEQGENHEVLPLLTGKSPKTKQLELDSLV